MQDIFIPLFEKKMFTCYKILSLFAKSIKYSFHAQNQPKTFPMKFSIQPSAHFFIFLQNVN